MSRSGKVKSFGVLAMVTAVTLGAIFAFIGPFTSGPAEENSEFPGITLGLTAEAREALQQSGNAFPANDAGFSAYHRVPDGGGGFGLDKSAVDQALFSDASPTLRRASPGTLLDMGENYTIGRVPIKNIDGLITDVDIYYDDQGWIVAYFPGSSESSRAWQAVELNIETPALSDVSRTTLLDAINDILVEALKTAPLGPDDLGYYHWSHPLATDFLMIATARGIQGSDHVSFAVPGNFTIHEVSVSMWISEIDMPCARTVLDGSNTTGDQCNRGFHHVFADLSDFNARSAHTLQLNHYSQDKGASGALVMLVYSTP